MLRSRRPSCFLRTLLLVLVALGVLIQPALAVASELHSIDHAAVTDGGDGHEGHRHLEDGQPEGDDPDHTLGLHGLMHQGNFGTSFMPPMDTLWLGPIALPVALSGFDDAVPAVQPLSQLLRPPIV